MSTQIPDKINDKTDQFVVKDIQNNKEVDLKNIKPLTRRDRAYKLQFRHKNRFNITSGQVKEKIFWFDGNRKEAIDRARRHCEAMDYTFLHCMVFIVDLDAQEALKAAHELSEDEEY
jgi:hypothetical protein